MKRIKFMSVLVALMFCFSISNSLFAKGKKEISLKDGSIPEIQNNTEAIKYTSSLVSKIYGKEGLKKIQELAKTIGLSEKQIFNILINNGVSKKDFNNGYKEISKQIKVDISSGKLDKKNTEQVSAKLNLYSKIVAQYGGTGLKRINKLSETTGQSKKEILNILIKNDMNRTDLRDVYKQVVNEKVVDVNNKPVSPNKILEVAVSQQVNEKKYIAENYGKKGLKQIRFIAAKTGLSMTEVYGNLQINNVTKKDLTKICKQVKKAVSNIKNVNQTTKVVAKRTFDKYVDKYSNIGEGFKIDWSKKNNINNINKDSKVDWSKNHNKKYGNESNIEKNF